MTALRDLASRWLWVMYLAVGGLLAAAYLFAPGLSGQAPLMTGLSFSSAGAIVLATRFHAPAARAPWLWFAAGQTLFALGDVYTYLFPNVGFPSLGDALYLAVYPVLMVGIVLLVRARNPFGDRAGVIDALIITVGVALLSWVFLMAPYVHDATLGPLAKTVSIAYPLGDVLLLAGAVRLAVDTGRKVPAFYLLTASVVALLVTDALYGLALLDGTYDHQLIYDAGWLAYYLLWGAAALHPSMRALGEASRDRETRLGSGRLTLLTGASLVAPVIEIVREANKGDVDLQVIILASMALFLLVILRMAGLVRQHERSVQRERVLRSAGSALVAATARQEISSAALAAASALLADSGSARLCVPLGDELTVLVDGDPYPSPVGEAVVARLDELVGGDGTDRLDDEATADLRVPPEAVFSLAVPLGGRHDRHGLLVTASGTPLSPLLIGALEALAAQASLALESAALSEEVHRRESEARFGSLVRHASDLITVLDPDGMIVYQSPSIERTLGLLPDAVTGRPFEELLAPGDRERVRHVLQGRGSTGAGTVLLECGLHDHEGRLRQFEVLATNLLEDEHVGGVVLNSRDVSERRAFEEQLAHQAFHDPVTDLPNRALFADRVRHALARSAREDQQVAVVFLDLDDFKTINDSLGHSAGDTVLQEVAERLSASVRPTDTAARFGGDEFAVLLEEVEGAQTAADVAERILEAFRAPVQLVEKELSVRPSIGIALSGAGECVADADDLIRNADAAMYIAKREGKGGYRVFEAAMHASVLERLELRADLQRAIEANEFELYFQPVVRLQDVGVSGVEALVRWHHPTRGLVQPAQFIGLAEEMGLIVDIGRWVLDEGCRQAAQMRASVPEASNLTLAVNLSVKQLAHPDLVDDVRDALERSGLPAESLVLEITESVLMVDTDRAIDKLEELKALGLRLAMDDFGTGYSSLSYLSRFPVDILKMDRSFLSSGTSAQVTGLASAIVALGASLDLDVVAEGIEVPKHLDTLRALGCDLGQGFFFARPMALDDTLRWLRDTRGGQIAPGTDERAA